MLTAHVLAVGPVTLARRKDCTALRDRGMPASLFAHMFSLSFACAGREGVDGEAELEAGQRVRGSRRRVPGGHRRTAVRRAGVIRVIAHSGE